jgi:hypothetical protein
MLINEFLEIEASPLTLIKEIFEHAIGILDVTISKSGTLKVINKGKPCTATIACTIKGENITATWAL